MERADVEARAKRGGREGCYNPEFWSAGTPRLSRPRCGSGGIGRRASLRSLLEQSSGGSSPLFRTSLLDDLNRTSAAALSEVLRPLCCRAAQAMTSSTAGSSGSVDARISPIRFSALVLAVVFAVMAAWAIAVRYSPSGSDFNSFYESGKAWRGLPESPDLPVDLNTPTLLLLFVPLSQLPLKVAFSVWTATGIASIVTSLFLLWKHRRPSREAMIWLMVGAVLWPPSLTTWLAGQISWLLLVPVVAAWVSVERSPVRSGVWLGLAVLIKPPLALMALLLPWRVGAPALLVAASGAALTAAIVGFAPWIDWLTRLRSVTWISHPLNASVFGLASHLWVGLHPVSPMQLPRSALASIAAIGAAVCLVTIRTTGDRRWALAALASVLLSPTGWNYYLVLAVPMLVGGRLIGGVAAWSALVFLTFPHSQMIDWTYHWRAGGAWLGSAYSLAALSLFFGALVYRPRHEPPVHARGEPSQISGR
jgi:hypothetical protein